MLAIGGFASGAGSRRGTKVLLFLAAVVVEMAIIALVPSFSYLALAVPAVLLLMAGLFIWPFGGLLLVAISLPFAPEVTIAGTVLTSTYAIMALAIVPILLRAAAKKEKLQPVPFALPVLVLVAVAAISSLNADMIWTPLKNSIHVLQLFALVPWMVVNVVKTARQVRYLVYCLLGSGLALSLYSLYQLRAASSISRVAGMVQNYNQAALYLGWIVLMLVSFGMYSASRKGRWIAIFLTMLVFFAFAATLSRGATLGLFAGMVGMAALARKKAGPMVAPLLLGVAVAGLVFAGPLSDRLQQTLSGGAGDRQIAWTAALNMMEDYPLLGNGLGNYSVGSVFYQYAPREVELPDQPHNFYLQIGAGYGVFGLLALIWFFGQVFWFEVRLFRRARSELTRELCLGCLGVHLLYVVAIFFDVGIVRSFELYPILLGLTVVVSRMDAGSHLAVPNASPALGEAQPVWGIHTV